VSANLSLLAPLSSIKILLTIFTPLLRTTPLGAVLFVTVKLQEPEKKELPQVEDRGEDEHSDLMQEEEPLVLIARDIGAHFTHPVAQKRGLIAPTSPEEKPTASPLETDDDAKLPAAFIAPNLFTNLQTSKSLNQETLSLSFLPSLLPCSQKCFPSQQPPPNTKENPNLCSWH